MLNDNMMLCIMPIRESIVYFEICRRRALDRGLGRTHASDRYCSFTQRYYAATSLRITKAAKVRTTGSGKGQETKCRGGQDDRERPHLRLISTVVLSSKRFGFSVPFIIIISV